MVIVGKCLLRGGGPWGEVVLAGEMIVGGEMIIAEGW